MKIEIPNLRFIPTLESAFSGIGITVTAKSKSTDSPHIIQLTVEDSLDETQKQAVKDLIQSACGSNQVFFDDDPNANLIFEI